MLKFCPNIDEGIVIPIPKFKKTSSFVTPSALLLLPSIDNFLKLLVFSELLTNGWLLTFTRPKVSLGAKLPMFVHS